MAPSIDVSVPVLGDLSPQALVEEHYKPSPDLPLGGLGVGLAPPGIRCGTPLINPHLLYLRCHLAPHHVHTVVAGAHVMVNCTA